MIASEEHANLQRLHIFGTPKASPLSALNHVSKSHAPELCWLLHIFSIVLHVSWPKQKPSKIKLESESPKWKLMVAGGGRPKFFVVVASSCDK